MKRVEGESVFLYISRRFHLLICSYFQKYCTHMYLSVRIYMYLSPHQRRERDVERQVTDQSRNTSGERRVSTFSPTCSVISFTNESPYVYLKLLLFPRIIQTWHNPQTTETTRIKRVFEKYAYLNRLYKIQKSYFKDKSFIKALDVLEISFHFVLWYFP